MTNPDRTSGSDLKSLRDQVDLTQEQVAAEMGTTQQYVSTIEGKAFVKAATADRYRAAVYAYTTREQIGA